MSDLGGGFCASSEEQGPVLCSSVLAIFSTCPSPRVVARDRTSGFELVSSLEVILFILLMSERKRTVDGITEADM